MSKLFNIYEGSKQTGNFGEHRSYYKAGKSHEGVDLAKPENSPINTRFDGVVKNVGYDPNGYGNYIDVSHGFTPDGKEIVTRYAHSNKISKKVGDKVNSGDVLGLVGSTGRSSGPHLHTELIIGNEKKNPMELQSYITSMNNKGNNKMAILPKGSTNVTPEDVEQAKQALLAQQQAEAGATQALVQRTPEEEALKLQTINALLDRIKKPDDPATKIMDWLKSGNPEIMGANLGRALSSAKVFNPKTGRVEDLAEPMLRSQEAYGQAQKEKQFEQEQALDKLIPSIYHTMNEVDAEAMREDRFNRQMQQQNDQFLKKMDYDREVRKEEAEALANKIAKQDEQQAFENNYKLAQLQETNRHNTETEKNNRAKQQNKANKYKQSIKDVQTAILQAQDVINLIDKNPKAIGYWVGSMAKGKPIQQKFANDVMSKDGVATRAAISKLRGVTLHDLTGSAQTLVEMQNLAPSLADLTDSPETAKKKLNQLIKELKNKENQYKSLLDDEDFDIDINVNPQSNVKVKSWKVVK